MTTNTKTKYMSKTEYRDAVQSRLTKFIRSGKHFSAEDFRDIVINPKESRFVGNIWRNLLGQYNLRVVRTTASSVPSHRGKRVPVYSSR